MPPRRKGRTLRGESSLNSSDHQQEQQGQEIDMQDYQSPTRIVEGADQFKTSNSMSNSGGSSVSVSTNGSTSATNTATARNTTNNNIFTNNSMNQYQKSFMSSSPSANSLLFGANHHVIRPTMNLSSHRNQERTDSEHSESFLNTRTFSVESFSDRGDNEDYLSPCSDTEDSENPSAWKSPLSAPVRMVDISSLIPEETIEYPEDDDIDVDPELLVIRSKLNTSDDHSDPRNNLVSEESKKKKLRSPRPKVVDETPFFQAHIHYDDEENQIDKVTTTFCGCFIEKIPMGIRTRVGYCGKKLCAPRFSVSIGLFIAFNAVAFILAVFCAIVLGLSYGDYPKMQRDPQAIAYIHKGCCEVFLQEKHTPVDNGYPYDLYLRVPIFGFSKMTPEQNDNRGYDIECEYEKYSHRIFDLHISGSAQNFTNRSFVDCFTDKDELVVYLEPYSYMYDIFHIVGIVSVVLSFSLFCLAVCSFALACIAFRKRKKNASKRSGCWSWLWCCCN